MIFCFLGGESLLRADIQRPGGGKKGTTSLVPSTDRPTEAENNARRALDIPSARNGKVSAVRGKPVEIILVSVASGPQDVEFLIGEMPTQGSLTRPALLPTARDKAQVVYTPTFDHNGTTDSFTFRVRHQGTPTSASATVNITIIDPEPRLSGDVQTDFGEVMMGETAARTLLIRNEGSGPWVGSPVLSPPWRMAPESMGLRRIEPNSVVELRAIFEPSEPSPDLINGSLSFEGMGGINIKLMARALAPFYPKPDVIVLEWNPGEKLRKASFTVVNRSQSALTVAASVPAPVEILPSTLKLEPRGVGTFNVIEKNTGAEFVTAITLSALGIKQSVRASAMAAPAYLSVLSVSGAQKSGDVLVLKPESPVTWTVKNSGGTKGLIFVEVPPGFETRDFHQGQEVEPGVEQKITLAIDPKQAIATEGRALLKCSEDILGFTVRADIPPPEVNAEEQAAQNKMLNEDTKAAVSSNSSRTSLAFASDEQATRAMLLSTQGAFPSDFKVDETLPIVEAAQPVSFEPTKCVMALRALAQDYEYILFRERFVPNKTGDLPVRCWIPTTMNWVKQSNAVLGTLEGLVPGGQHWVRLAVRSKDGRYGPPSPPFKITMPVQPRTWLKWLKWGGVLASILILLFIWWRNHSYRY